MTAQDVYAANLRQRCGHPLHSPEPSSHLREPYALEGFQIGDVGYLTSEGEFNPLFNIVFPPEDQHCDVHVPPYEPVKLSGPPYRKPGALPEGHVFMSGVKQDVNASTSDGGPVTYKFTANSHAGAILILPSGATLFDLQNQHDLEAFRQLATRHARQWCEIRNDDSLYLITGLYKARDFTLAAFNTGHSDGEMLVKKDQSGTYKWTCAFETYFRPGPRKTNYENHTVLIKGFRMTVRWNQLAVIERVTRSESPFLGRIGSLVATLLFALLEAVFATVNGWLSRTTIEHSPHLSQPLHPSDIINRYLLDKNPGASVAITHDNAWIDMLQKKRLSPEDLMQENSLRSFLEMEYTWHVDRGVVYLGSPTGNTDNTHHDQESSRLRSTTEKPVHIVITHIRAENLTARLRRVPVGFYVQVNIPDRPSIRTKNKTVSVYDRVVQWDDAIHLPSNPSLMVTLTVFASFEFDPMLGRGEPLLTLEKSVDELQTRPFTLFDKQGGDVLPCASLFVAMQEWHCNHQMPPSCEMDVTLDQEKFPEFMGIMDGTNQGHDALLRYHKDRSKESLRDSITHFQRVLHHCTRYPDKYRAAALSNLATAKFITCQAQRELHNLHDPISLYRGALKLRPGDHQDRPMTLLHLAQAILYRYEVEGCTNHDDDIDELLQLVDEIKRICPEGSHARRAADQVLNTYERLRLKDSHDLDGLNELISKLDAAAQELLDTCFDGHLRLYDLGLASQRRFLLRREAGLVDLNRAIERLKKAIQIIPDDHPDKSNYLNNHSVTVWIHQCETLYAEGRTIDVATSLLEVKGTINANVKEVKIIMGWLLELAKQVKTTLEKNGDDASSKKKYSEAVKAYSTALSLAILLPPDPNNRIRMLIKQCKARASKIV